MNTIRIGIVGYGNLGKSTEAAIQLNKDMRLVGVFTRRNPSATKTAVDGVPVFHVEEAVKMLDEIDVVILCGGSMSDLPVQGPMFAGRFNTVDGFDTHSKIPDYFNAVNEKATEGGKISIISSGWDPGMFSLNRLFAEAILPEGYTYTFWGKGVSQGHSDAVRRLKGVKDARQYTIPLEDAIHAARSGEKHEFSSREQHQRECFVVAEEGADRQRIEHEIKTMPNYFADYDTTVHFITEEEMERNHSGLPHGGMVLRRGRTGFQGENHHTIEYKLDLDSNPDFTASVLVAYARAAFRLHKEGACGAKTVADIPPAYLSGRTAEEIRSLIL